MNVGLMDGLALPCRDSHALASTYGLYGVLGTERFVCCERWGAKRVVGGSASGSRLQRVS